MEEFQHTPGPWTIVASYTGERFKWIRILIGTPKPAGSPSNVITGKFVATVEEVLERQVMAMANARLIAAASDLLAACERVYADLMAFAIPAGRQHPLQREIDVLRAAIARAHGEEVKGDE